MHPKPSATVILDSVNPVGVRLITLQLSFQRFLLPEFNTHRVFSRSAGSSRAIPVSRVLEQVRQNPAGPLVWGKNRPGMQSTKELTGWRLWAVQKLWGLSAKLASACAWGMMKVGVHKQVANRILEPFQMISVIVTATDWDNFFELRCHPDAQPEMQALALEMFKAIQESAPRSLRQGEWHLPYVTPRDYVEASRKLQMAHPGEPLPGEQGIMELLLKASTARCARVSYANHDGSKPDLDRDIALHDQLVASRPIHASPAEHQAQAMDDSHPRRNFRGWRQYRVDVEESLQRTE